VREDVVSRIFIVGSGVVGSATGRALLRAGHRVTFVDVAPRRVAALAAEGLDARSEMDLSGEPEAFIWLCLPTPIDATGYQLAAVMWWWCDPPSHPAPPRN
jgi:UDPglucose 6-dehydrogenase